MSRNEQTLPAWIPDHARRYYAITGPYSEPHLEKAMHTLFHAETLKDFFLHLDRQGLSFDAWEHLIRQIISSLECIPDGGAATRARPDTKTQIRDNQSSASKKLAAIATQAQVLARLLDDLDGLGATVPGEMYSSMAWLRTAVQGTVVQSGFKQHLDSQSSYYRSSFPPPARLLEVLAEAANSHPAPAEVFAGDAWLSSQKSTWRDFVRMMREALEEIDATYDVSISLNEKHWVRLVQTLISKNITRSSVKSSLL